MRRIHVTSWDNSIFSRDEQRRDFECPEATPDETMLEIMDYVGRQLAMERSVTITQSTEDSERQVRWFEDVKMQAAGYGALVPEERSA